MGTEHHSLELAFESVDQEFNVRSFSITEEISRLWSVRVTGSCSNDNVPLADIIGKGAGFRISNTTQDGDPRYWTGMVEQCELLHANTTRGSTAQSTYFFHIVPLLWRTTQRRNQRIFQREKLPDIVKQLVEGDWKLEPRWNLKRDYNKHDYVVQYGETDFEFISRILEWAGISFFYEFKGGQEPKLVFCDAPTKGPERSAAISAFDEPPSAKPDEYARRVRTARTVQPGRVRLRDYEFRRQYNTDLIAESAEQAEQPEDFYEQYHYAPGSFYVDSDNPQPSTPKADDKGIKPRHDEKQGKLQADLILKALRKHKRVVSYETNCLDLAPGTVFKFKDHPRDDLDRKPLLSTGFSLEGRAEGDWVFSGTAHYTDYDWVPDRRHEKPRIVGMQSAFVVGKQGEEIHTDEHGRVRVQFHWDRQGRWNDESSRWLRVSQDWAGAGFGSFMLPRVGHEVMVAFYDGDPDQPVVVGRVYNKFNAVPYALPEHKTKSTWKGDSTPKGDGMNEITLDDKKGEELFYLRAERDLDKLVKNYETERTFDNHLQTVGTVRETVVGELEATMVGRRYLMQVMGKPTADDIKLPSITPKETTFEMKKDRIVFTTGKATLALIGNDIRMQADGIVTIHAKGADCILDGKNTLLNSGSPKKVKPPKKHDDVEAVEHDSEAADRIEQLQLAVEWAAEIAESAPEVDPGKLEAQRNAIDTRVELVEDNYHRAMSGEDPLPEHITKERLKLAHDGDDNGVRVPLNWESAEQFEEFKKELVEELAAAGVTDAQVVQIGSATTGWQGNPHKIPPKHWQTTSDADFAIYSPQAMAQAKAIGAPPNKKVVMNGKYSIVKNGTAEGNGFNDTPAGQRLEAFSRRWNKKLYGQEDVDGVDFKLNLLDEPMPMSTKVL